MKNTKNLLIIFLAILVLCMAGFIIYEKVLNNKAESDDKSVREYRFFGYETDNDPDMYTTLRLYANNKYVFYVNNCEGLTKYDGTYTETDSKLTLNGYQSANGDKNIDFVKKITEMN